jgi:uncharacterized Fe-S cluster-containing radical SAM superfamily protein
MQPGLPFNPVRRSGEMESLVMKGEKRLYYKFRGAPYYGGIATADAVGCSFLCAYCWNYGRNEDPSRHGSFYAPEEVAENLLRISRRRGFHLFRVTGSEPVLGEASLAHLLKVMELIFRGDHRSHFVLETNGLMLGFRPELGEKLRFRNLLVRIALKGADPLSFERVSGAAREFFPYPLLALKNLQRLNVRAWPALMGDLFSPAEIGGLKNILRGFTIKDELELESLEPYPFVLENLRRRKLVPRLKDS